MNTDELRAALKAAHLPISRVASIARIAPSTLYSFVSGDTRSLRADAHQAVEAALGKAPKGVHEDAAPFETDPTEVTISAPSTLLQEAERLGLDATALLTEGGVSGLRAAIKSAFVEKNQAGIAWSRAYVQKHGTIAQQFGLMARETE